MNSYTKIFGNNQYSSSKNIHELAIIPNDSLWGEKLKNYQKSKEIIYHNKNDFPKIITKDLVRSTEGEFNPITQRYKDPKKDYLEYKSAKKRELNFISTGYDKQLELESTYNLINLSNKLKYFNYEEPSLGTVPNKIINNKGKEKQFNYEKINKKPYNILTNYPLKENNYYFSSKPRTTNSDKNIKMCKEGLSEFDRKNKKMEIDKFKKDFNIINNEYKIFNKEKKEAEKEIQNLNAIKKMENRKTYDILNCRYINPMLENEFVKKYENRKKLLLSKTKDKNFIIRNPINNMIYDEEAQKKLDDIEMKKKRRFNSYHNVDNYYHSIGNNIEIKKDEMVLTHGNPLDLNVKNKRGFDIINGHNFLEDKIKKNNKGDYLTNINMAKKEGQYYDKWEKIKSKVNQNSLISKKPIFKEPYDSSDVEKNFQKYMQNRNTTLMNSKNLNRNYGTFKSTENILNQNKMLNNNYRNSYTATDSITRTNNINIKKSNSISKNDNRNFNTIKSNNMDKNKFFGLSYIIKK